MFCAVSFFAISKLFGCFPYPQMRLIQKASDLRGSQALTSFCGTRIRFSTISKNKKLLAASNFITVFSANNTLSPIHHLATTSRINDKNTSCLCNIPIRKWWNRSCARICPQQTFMPFTEIDLPKPGSFLCHLCYNNKCFSWVAFIVRKNLWQLNF